MKKYLKIEYLIYLMLIVSPILDSTSFIYRTLNPDALISPVTIIRPIIPSILALYMFIKYKNTRKVFIIGAMAYLIYGLIHLVLYNNLITEVSYGSTLFELQYIINYTYMIIVLYIVYYFNKIIKLDKIKEVLFIMLSLYLILIIMSLITGTSSSTYIEGLGYKGWNASGNALGSILILLECLLVPYIFKNKKIIQIVVFLLLGVFLTFLLGTRVGLFGFYLVICVYFIASIILTIIKKNTINFKRYLLPMILILVVGISSVLVFGSNTLSRRNFLKDIEGNLHNTDSEIAHTTGDTVKFVNMIKNENVSETFLSSAQQKAYLSMYEFANKYKITNNNQRVQQLVYHLYLIKYQKNPYLILFGNGYGASYGEMTLEMEFIALLLNFGILGFILYMIPFLMINIKVLIYAFKNTKKLDIEFVMYLIAAFLGIVFSILAGYTFFNVSSMCIIVMSHILLINKYNEKNEIV